MWVLELRLTSESTGGYALWLLCLRTYPCGSVSPPRADAYAVCRNLPPRMCKANHIQVMEILRTSTFTRGMDILSCCSNTRNIYGGSVFQSRHVSSTGEDLTLKPQVLSDSDIAIRSICLLQIFQTFQSPTITRSRISSPLTPLFHFLRPLIILEFDAIYIDQKGLRKCRLS